MRKILLAISATIAIVAASSMTANQAQALPLSAPAGVNAAVNDAGLVQQANYGRRWSYGYQGCGWRGCYWTPRYRYHYQPYSYYQPYNYYRPYRYHRYW
jgi:hypothetical protein